MPGATRSDGETFFGINLHYAEKFVKIFEVPWAPSNINTGRAITWLVGITIYCTILKITI